MALTIIIVNNNNCYQLIETVHLQASSHKILDRYVEFTVVKKEEKRKWKAQICSARLLQQFCQAK